MHLKRGSPFTHAKTLHAGNVLLMIIHTNIYLYACISIYVYIEDVFTCKYVNQALALETASRTTKTWQTETENLAQNLNCKHKSMHKIDLIKSCAPARNTK